MLDCDKDTEIKMVKFMIKRSREFHQKLREGNFSVSFGGPLFDFRNYFIYKVLQSKDEREIMQNIRRFEYYERIAKKNKDEFHQGFFFSLSQISQFMNSIINIPKDKVFLQDVIIAMEKSIKELKKEDYSFFSNEF